MLPRIKTKYLFFFVCVDSIVPPIIVSFVRLYENESNQTHSMSTQAFAALFTVTAVWWWFHTLQLHTSKQPTTVHFHFHQSKAQRDILMANGK